MMSEGEVRELLAELTASNAKETNPARVLAFSGGLSALKMVLGEDK
jgi:hypothetical protein